MKYSYDYKMLCIEQYRQGKWPETPEGVKEKTFHDMIRIWSSREAACGSDGVQHKNQNKKWTAERKYTYVAKVLAGESYKKVAISAGIECSLLYQWVKRYKIEGYMGLVTKRKGRPPKEPQMKKKELPAELTPSEREEMIRLRAENEVIKKEIALREERQAAQLKARKQRSSKNFVKKDTP